jgi:outer membrane protein assembly factor BamB
MTLRTSQLKLTTVTLIIGTLCGCNEKNSHEKIQNEQPPQLIEIVYGGLNGTQAIVPKTKDEAFKNRIVVNGNTSLVIKSLDVSSHVEAGGIDPTLYLLGNNSPMISAPNQWSPNKLPTHVEENSSEAKGFYALHGDSRNSDEVQSVTPPETQLSWIAEKTLFSYEGGVFDRNSHVYVAPIDPVENTYMVSIDGETGERRWSLPGKRIGQGGAPLILPASNDSSADIIYIGGYEYLTAVNSNGKVIWDVATGLIAPKDATQIGTHNFGVNYHQQSNSVVALYADGHVVVHDRETGRPLLEPFSLPGSTAVASNLVTNFSVLEPFVHKGLSTMFENTQTFFDVLNMVLGGGYEVANYFAIDPNSGRLFVAATAPDEADGNVDNLSALGALYALNLTVEKGVGELSIQWRRDFEGGSAATPTLSFDGRRVYTADATDKMLAIDATTGDDLWQFSTGSGQVVGSVAVSREGDEIYASTGSDIIKVLDMGDCAGDGIECDSPVWTANLNGAFDTSVLQKRTPQAHIYVNVFKPAFEGFYKNAGNLDFEFKPTAGNLVLAGVTANGVIAQAGFGYLSPLQRVLPFQISQLLLDRETGGIRYSAPGVEESISVMAQAPNGNVYMSNSPLRRILNIGILRAVGHKMDNDAFKYFGMEALGGIAQFTQTPGQKINLAKEVAQTVIERITNLMEKMGAMSQTAVNAEIKRLDAPVSQFSMSLNQARDGGEISDAQFEAGMAVHAAASVNDSTQLREAKSALQEWLSR